MIGSPSIVACAFRRSAGSDLLATFEQPHFTLVLPDVAELTIARLTRSFDDPIPNPGRPVHG